MRALNLPCSRPLLAQAPPLLAPLLPSSFQGYCIALSLPPVSWLWPAQHGLTAEHLHCLWWDALRVGTCCLLLPDLSVVA